MTLNQRTIEDIISALEISVLDPDERKAFYTEFIKICIDEDVELDVLKRCNNVDDAFDDAIEEYVEI